MLAAPNGVESYHGRPRYAPSVHCRDVHSMKLYCCVKFQHALPAHFGEQNKIFVQGMESNLLFCKTNQEALTVVLREALYIDEMFTDSVYMKILLLLRKYPCFVEQMNVL